MKMSEYIAAGYSSISGPDAIKNRQIGALKYIQNLASSSGTNISYWDVDDIFKDTDDKFPIDRSKINKIFFQAKKKYSAAEGSNLDPAFVASLQEVQESVKKSFVEQCQKEHDQCVERAKRCLIDYERALRLANQQMIKMRMTDNETGFLTGQIKKLADTSRWDNFKIDGHIFSAVTKTPVVLNHIHKEDGIDHTLLMGHYRVFCDVRSYTVTAGIEKEVSPPYASRFQGTLDHCHPHVNMGGGICFGSLSEAITLSQAEQNIVDVFDIVEQVLRNYNDDDAYTGLYRFVEIEKSFVEDSENTATEIDVGPIEEGLRIRHPDNYRDAISEILQFVLANAPTRLLKERMQSLMPFLDCQEGYDTASSVVGDLHGRIQSLREQAYQTGADIPQHDRFSLCSRIVDCLSQEAERIRQHGMASGVVSGRTSSQEISRRVMGNFARRINRDDELSI